MWVVAKVRIKDLNTFKKSLAEKVGDGIKFYHPKIEYYKHFGDKVKRFEKFILENYVFCYHAKYKKSNSAVVSPLKMCPVLLIISMLIKNLKINRCALSLQVLYKLMNCMSNIFIPTSFLCKC